MSVRSFNQSTITNQKTYRNFSSRYGGLFPFDLNYLVIAGGGGSGESGAGAGGYRNSYPGEQSGRSSATEIGKTYSEKSVLTVTVGAGGAASTNGGNSVFDDITSLGGGRGRGRHGAGYSGGSGGGAAAGNDTNYGGGSGTTGQGYNGGGMTCRPGNLQGAGGGGGAGGNGGDGRNGAGSGGAGLTSSITGTAVARAGGGANNGSASSGGGVDGSNGTANTGGGAGGGNRSGGSGIVILRFNKNLLFSASPGVSFSTTTVGEDNVYQITAAGPSDTVTIG